MSDVRIRLSSKGMAALLKSEGVHKDLQARVRRVEAQARRDYAGLRLAGYRYPPVIDANVINGKTRARGSVIVVHPLAASIEADRRILGRALNAAKG